MLDLPFSGALPQTKLAIEASLQAGRKVIEIYHREVDFEVSDKEDRSPVTMADVVSNRIIGTILSSSQIPILSEEGEREVKPDLTKTWIIDPLDGTREFVDKNGEFTIMISFVEDHVPLIGVIYSPVNDSLYIAQKDKGAYRYDRGKWQRLKVSNIDRVEDARAVLSRSHITKEELDFVKYLNLHGFSRLGSSLKVLAICSGAAEIYFAANRSIKQWDTCASNCLITEAGGRMTDMYGSELVYNKGSLNHESGILATNGFLHNQIIEKSQVLRKKAFKG
jgi:3'(2'), 5'-bisphosphate nucleotidase